MTRKLGMALLAALAIGAVGAQGASAHEFTSNAATTDITATSEGNLVLQFKPAGSAITCTHVLLEGTQLGSTFDALTMTPTYSNCKVGALTATVTDTGCGRTYDSDTTSDPHHVGQTATVSLECNHSGSIDLEIFASANHAAAPICTITFGDTHNGATVNQDLHGVTYANTGTGTTEDVTITEHVKTIVFTSTGPQCAAAGLPATGKEAAIDAKYVMRGYIANSAHNVADHVGITVD